SLLSIFGTCKTSLGSRLLKRNFSNPTRNLNILATRHSIKNSLGENQHFIKIQDVLSYISDIETIISLEAIGTVKPKDL
ncbi:hypothetical protein, partial [Francisella tularensis]|uniref:hypothetical protein n=1 Tax=Francisella tularensis TaxID=263 RepID=UPI002381B49D